MILRRAAPPGYTGAAMIRGVLFDLDGTLADTERLHWRAYGQVLEEFGVRIGLDEYRREFIAKGGGPEYACRTYRLPISPDELRERKVAPYRALIDAHVDPLPGAVEALRRLRADYRLAVATNSSRDEATRILGHLDARALLHALVPREAYGKPKPAPDAYLTAAAEVGLAPGQCVVVEDTPRGLVSGLAAGMRTIVVPSDLTADADFPGAARRIASLHELTPALLAELDGGRPGNLAHSSASP
jgi:HAD superfamily hydrolase (TIGR01509 family)